MHRSALGCALALVLTAASPAHADEPLIGTLRKVTGLWSESEEGEIRRKIAQAREQIDTAIVLGNAFLANNQPTEARFDVFAEAGAGLDERAASGAGTIGAVFAVRSERCDLLQAGLSIRGDLRSKDPNATGGAQQWLQICLSGGLGLDTLMELDAPGLTLFPLVLRESALVLARPRLTGPRASIDEDYSDIGYGFDVEGARYLWAKDRGIGFAGFTADQRYRWRHWYGGESAKVEISGSVWFVRLLHTRGELALADRFIDILAFGFHGIQADNGAAIVNAWPVRFYGIGLFGTDRVLVDADLGVGGTGTVGSETNGPGVHETITIGTSGLPDVTIAVAHVALHSGDVRRSLSVSYDRTVDTNILADVITEDRFTISGQFTDATWIAHGAAFVSRAHYFIDEGLGAEERVAGATFTGSYALPQQLSLGLTLEGVLGISARDPMLDGHALPRGLRAFATLSTTRTLWKL